MGNSHKPGAAPSARQPPKISMGEGGENIYFLNKHCSFSLFLIYGKNANAKESREEPFFAAGDAARCRDGGSAGMLQTQSFSGCLQKGSQTAGRRRGRESRTSILTFKMQIPPLSFRWRGQGLLISSSPRSDTPSPFLPEFCLGRDCRCDKVFVLAIQLNEKAEESQRREQTFGGQRGQLRINVSYCLY